MRVQFLNESVSESFPESDVPTFTVCINVTQGVPSFDHNVSLAPDPSATAMMGIWEYSYMDKSQSLIPCSPLL